MKCRGSLWVGEIASQSGLSRTCRGAGGRKPEGRAERSCAAASAQVQGWKLPDRRAEHASSLPSHQRPARQRGSGRNPAETGAPLPDDAFRGHRTPAVALPEGRRAGAAASRSRAAALGWVGAAESLHPQQSCRIQAGSSQPAPEQGSRGHSCKHRPQLTAPPCTAQHSTTPTPAALQQPQLVVPPARTPHPWGRRWALGCLTAPGARGSLSPGQHLHSARSSSAQGSALLRWVICPRASSAVRRARTTRQDVC